MLSLLLQINEDLLLGIGEDVPFTKQIRFINCARIQVKKVL